MTEFRTCRWCIRHRMSRKTIRDGHGDREKEGGRRRTSTSTRGRERRGKGMGEWAATAAAAVSQRATHAQHRDSWCVEGADRRKRKKEKNGKDRENKKETDKKTLVCFVQNKTERQSGRLIFVWHGEKKHAEREGGRRKEGTSDKPHKRKKKKNKNKPRTNECGSEERRMRQWRPTGGGTAAQVL